MDNSNMNYQNTTLQKTENVPDEVVNVKKEEAPPKEKVKEKFGFVDFDTPGVINQQYGNMAKTQRFDNGYEKRERAPNSTVQNVTPITEQLLSESPTYSYTDQYFNNPSTRMYLQDVQPKLYSFAVDQTPINSNIGMTYMPQRAPRFMDQITDANKKNYPLMTRIDPQLIRDDGTPGQVAINPTRSNWSAEYSDYRPPKGSINFEDIYDPRFTSYGDEYRSYSDVNLGQVRYYYGDIDAYRMPNFIQRSNVDFIEFQNPNNDVWPYYQRTASLDDVKASVESQTTADEIYHREDMMENIMAKMNRENYQLRYAPLRRSANSNMPFGPT